jgi:hypothetical protein
MPLSRTLVQPQFVILQRQRIASFVACGVPRAYWYGVPARDKSANAKYWTRVHRAHRSFKPTLEAIAWRGQVPPGGLQGFRSEGEC